jgi:hypothetical protein
VLIACIPWYSQALAGAFAFFVGVIAARREGWH